MSRARSYAYAAPTPPRPPSPPACYYYDDMEGYVGDYSESDGLSDGGGGTAHVLGSGTPAAPPPDVTEIYRRKATGMGMPTAIASPPPHNAQVDYHAVYAPHEYYYDPGTHQAAAIPRRAAVAYRKRVSVMSAERAPRYYSPDSGELYDAFAFRSTHQMMPPPNAVVRNLPPRVPSATAIHRQGSARRHPITVRTPRYYRRPGSTTLYKRPSALCLPVGCQPDPAVYKRSKRSSSDQIYAPEYVYHPTTIQPVKPPPAPSYQTEKAKSGGGHKVTPQTPPPCDFNDLNVTRSKLDAALQRYEQIFEKSSNCPNADHRYQDVKMAQMLKPKVPQNIKEKQQEQTPEKNQSKQQEHNEKHEEKHKSRSKKCSKIDWENARVLEVECAESDALEKILLADLKANGFVGGIESDTHSESAKKEKKQKSPRRSEKKAEKPVKSVEENADVNLKDLPKSFNYQEIQTGVVKAKQIQHNQQIQQQAELKQYHSNQVPDNLSPSKKSSRNNLVQGDIVQMSDTTYSRPTSARGSSVQVIPSKRQQSTENLHKGTESTKSVRAGVVPRVLVDDALELHRTKSYVVNLIDHALSNHFGTNLCEKYSTKENPIDHRVAIELLKKHSTSKMNKDLCLEIAQALADTFNNNNNSSTSCSTATQIDAKQETSTCSCNKSAEEPLYVKQLKQLRWGHLKHIQREVRRLEDLERFLDSCSSNTFS